MSERTDRRTNAALRRRIDHLLARVRESRDEIVERGLSAVHPHTGADASRPCDGAAATSLGHRRGAH
jgi:hypothetical protein